MKRLWTYPSVAAGLIGALMLAGSVTGQVPESARIPGAARDAFTPPPIPGQNVNGLRVYLRVGLKTHGDGEHDYPQFLADWSKLLTVHGAVVDGSFHAPNAEELARTDVVVIYKGDAGYMSRAEKAALDGFVQRGGGLVILHDGLCGPDPAAYAQYVGAGKQHGEVNFTLNADLAYKITAPNSPIMKGMTNLDLRDEAFFKMTWASNPGITPLATVTIPDVPTAKGHVGEVVPQIWTYEHKAGRGDTARAFVWLQGHNYANFQNPQIRDMLLRGIAWAGKHPVDELVDYKPPAPRR